MKLQSYCTMLAISSMFFFSASNANANEEILSARGVTVSVVVKAHPQIAYQAIRNLRNEDDSCKVISTNSSSAIVEESFDELPMIGKAKCIYEEKYVSSTRIDYQMKSSDKFKAFEGCWTLTPQKNGEETLVQLRSYVDTGLKIPFARQITNTSTTSEIKQKLADVKKSAESTQNKVAFKSQAAH